MTSTFFSSQSDAPALNDLRAWSEMQLIAAAKGGERPPFGELCERHMKQVLGVTRRIMPNREDAEDAVQDSFLSAFVHLKDFDGRSRFATWLTRIAINAALGKLRKRALWKESSLDEPRESEDGSYIPLEIESWGENPEEACLKSALQQVLSEVIQKLDPKSRTIFTLRDVEKFSIEETAKLLSLSIPVVKTRLLRSRLKLREELTKYFGKDARNAMPTSHR